MVCAWWSDTITEGNNQKKKLNASKKAGVKNIRLHDFRDSYATNLVENHVPAIEVQKRLGHANITTTLDYYVHSTRQTEKEANAHLEKMLKQIL